MTTPVSVEPIPVQITNHPQPKVFGYRSAYRSVMLTAQNPYLEIAGYDPLRTELYLYQSVNAYVIAGSTSQASDGNNLAASITAPNGTYIPASSPGPICLKGQNEVWVATGTYPTIIGYQIVRKVPE